MNPTPGDDYFKNLKSCRKLLGSGKDGQVFLYTEATTGNQVAVKTMKSCTGSLNEVRALWALQGVSGVINVRWFKYGSPDATSADFHNNALLSICLDKADTDLLKLRNSYERADQLPLPWTQWTFARICEAVHQVHAKGIHHLDIKAENILLLGTFPNYTPRLADFSLSVPASAMLRGQRGTHYYMAPEIFSGAAYRGGPCDVWSLGILLLVCVAKIYPWDSATIKDPKFRAYLATGALPVPPMDPCLDHLVRSLLTVDPARRPTIEAVLAHPWLHGRPLPQDAPLPDSLAPQATSTAATAPPAHPAPAPSSVPAPRVDIPAPVPADLSEQAIVFEMEPHCDLFTSPKRDDAYQTPAREEHTYPAGGAVEGEEDEDGYDEEEDGALDYVQ